MSGTQGPTLISTKLDKIATIAKQYPNEPLNNLNHYIDLDLLKEAYQRTRKDGAPGVDGVTGEQYEEALEENLSNLLERFKSGKYRAPLVKRVYIPKDKPGERRALGLPTFEDKVLQRAVLMVLDPIYELEFHEDSYGFRRGRSVHQACRTVQRALWNTKQAIVLEFDIRKCFDSIPKKSVQDCLRKRVTDGVILRTIGKWLNAGILEDDTITYSITGCPQGGVLSPFLMNVYLHELLDEWIEKVVRDRLSSPIRLVRYADDGVLIFSNPKDAQRVLEVLPKRFARYGLALHPDKTGLVNFCRPSTRGYQRAETFDFLGFTYYWGKSRKGKMVIKLKTSKARQQKTLRKVKVLCKRIRHWKLKNQHARLNKALHGIYNHFGVTFNFAALKRVLRATERIWQSSLGRRCQGRTMPFSRFKRLLGTYPLVQPFIKHNVL